MVKSVAKIFKGDGTLESPYLIETTEDMVKLADFIDLTSFDYSGFCFRLVNDLDFKGADWKIIVPNTTRFNASFDGNGKTISGYRFENLDNATGVGRFVGPFGVVGQSGAIRNLTVAGSFSTRQYAGGVAGLVCTGMTVDNCYNDGEVTMTATPGINYAFANTTAIGGFAGSIRGNVSNSWNSGNVTSDYVAVGGLCGILSGENADGTPNVLNCFNTGDIHAKGQLAGANTAADGKSYRTKFYNLDAILSVGYRVNSRNATLFRQWANKVLKEYLLRGYSINQRLMHIENRIDHRLSEHDIQIKELSNRMDFFVRTSLPPREGIIFDGQIFDAYTLMCDLIRSAKTRIIMVDNYIDDSVFLQLDKRAPGVSATIFTPSVSRVLRQDLERHNAQYAPIEVRTFRRAHDLFLIIDDTVYHVGASFKDLGKKLTAFSKVEIMTADEFIAYLGRKDSINKIFQKYSEKEVSKFGQPLIPLKKTGWFVDFIVSTNWVYNNKSLIIRLFAEREGFEPPEV